MSRTTVLGWRLTAALAAGMLAAAATERLFADDAAIGRPLFRDEEFVVRFRGPAPLARVIGGGIRMTRPTLMGPRGRFVLGRTLLDPATGRVVTVRPEALREFFVVLRGLSPTDADEQAARVLARVERTGDLAPLDAIDAELRVAFGDAAGTRLDDPAVTAFIPPPVEGDTPTAALRRLAAGDDEKWRAYLVEGDINAFAALEANPAFERFHHPVDPLSGIPSLHSALRQREHRRVLVRRSRNVVTFLPDIPMHSDLADAGYDAAATYDVRVAPALRTSVRDIVLTGGDVIRFVKGKTSFTTLPDGQGSFLGGNPGEPVGPPDPPRVVNVTPPHGETLVDRATDWEDPDNQFLVPVVQRRLFTVRVRFSRPLDPRTADAAHFSVRKVGSLDGVGNETPVDEPVAVGVFLAQRRTGEILVEITPWQNPDPQSRYELRVEADVLGLDGTPLGTPFVSRF
jgi:hypothetical protein